LAKNHLNGFLPMDNKHIKIKEMQKDISLKELTTFRIGGKAKYFCQVSDKDEVVGAVKWAKQKRLPFFVLGGGSNVLKNDRKYKGLVIQVKSQNAKVKIENQKSKVIIIETGAGVSLGKLVGIALQNNLTGMEWAMGIPGAIGGAVYGNAGAFGFAMGDNIEEVETLDISNIKYQISNIKKEECEFRYRDSIFKKNKNLIILSAKIKLQTGEKTEIENKMKGYFQKKKQTQPLEFFCAGSIFKNQELEIENQELLEKFPELKKFQDKNIIPAAWFIEKAGLKGKRIGGVEISPKHSNFIVSNGFGKARDVKKLIDLIKKQVKKKFNIILEEEIQLINF